MIVSCAILAYNEENYLPELLKDMAAQTYDHSKTEILLIDSMSNDRTWEIMQKFKKEATDFLSIRLYKNEKKIQASGWNVAISNYKGDILARIDAHTKLSNDFVYKNVKHLERCEDICGGIFIECIKDKNYWKEALLAAENSAFGGSIAKHTKELNPCYVKSIFQAFYKREVINKLKNFNENLARTEDNEFHYRIRKKGYKFYCDPSIQSFHYIRPTLKKVMKQKFGNGYWIGLTVGVCPKCLELHHFIPFLFVMGIIVSTILICFQIPYIAILLWILYEIFAFAVSFMTAINEKKIGFFFLLPILFLTIHIPYGLGTLIGLCRMPIWRKGRVCKK